MVLTQCKNTRLEEKDHELHQDWNETLSDAWMKFKRMMKACPHQDSENHLNTFFFDGLDNQTRALLDSSVGVGAN